MNKTCPKCGNPCDRDEANVGVGYVYGPWGCGSCYWSEDENYDLSNGKKNQVGGGIIDQYGGWTPKHRGSSLRREYQEYIANIEDGKSPMTVEEYVGEMACEQAYRKMTEE